MQDGAMIVCRIQTATGSHIDPPLEQGWSDLKKLRWQAAVVAVDCGVAVSIGEGGLSTKRFGKWHVVPGMFSFALDNSSGGAMSFESMWSFLDGISLGAKKAHAAAVIEALSDLRKTSIVTLAGKGGAYEWFEKRAQC